MKLKKALGLLEVFCLASGSMISAGIFILPGIAFAKAGPGVVVSYFLSGLLALTGMLSIAEIATAMPKAGGDYFYVARTLEDELREVIRERDELEEDRFDRVISKSTILDLTAAASMEEFFQTASEALSERLGVPPETLKSKLLERENESTTAITPLIAIPHVIIDGTGAFDILIARCREGIRFSESATDNVQAVFVLVGTRDERHFHLTALAAIAQIVQSEHFTEWWLKAKKAEDLRDVLLLGKRLRH